MDQPPVIFGEWYELVGELGRGTTGIVYKARDTKLNRQVAIKVPDLSPENERLLISRRFMRECRILADLTQGADCNIPRLHAVLEVSGQPFSVQEYVEGKTFQQCVTDGSIDLRTGMSVIADIARVIQFVHNNGIAHQNLSPENVLLERDGTAWLIGFGRARAIDDILRSANSVAGKPVEVDVQGLLTLLRLVSNGLGESIPIGLERATVTNSVLTAGAFGELLSNHL